jgi:transposase
LPAKLRSVVELIYLLGLSYAETAERLKVPVGTVKSRLHHAIERLRRESGELSAAPPGKPGDVCGPGDLENRLAARRNSENQPPSRT